MKANVAGGWTEAKGAREVNALKTSCNNRGQMPLDLAEAHGLADARARQLLQQ